MIRIAHILCPFRAPESSDLSRAQPITFASMRRARLEAEGLVNVDFYSAQFAEDRDFVPEEFIRLPDLDRSIVDVAKVRSPRKLPVFRDVMDRLYAESKADYFIYTNVDIALMPNFYRVVLQYILKGYDAFAINRRRIPARFTDPAQLDLMYAEAGETHTGYDTLVFHRDLLPKFTLSDVCIGVPFFDTVLIHNLYAHAKAFRLFTGKHLTFHVGMELVKRWGDTDQYAHNRKQYMEVLKTLYPLFRIETFPGASLPFFARHFKWLMNPTFHYPTMFRLDFAQLRRLRRPYPPREHDAHKGWANWLIRRINFPDEE